MSILPRTAALLLIPAIVLAVETDDRARCLPQIVIIAPEEFSDPELHSESLNRSIRRAASGLADYFRDKFRANPSDCLYIATSPEATTAQALRDFFSGPYIDRSRRSLTLIFWITHGIKLDDAPVRDVREDLILATSDTQTANPAGRGIWLAQDLLDWLKLTPAGSFVVTFVDTCFAGDISPTTRHRAAELEDAGVMLGILGASQAEEKTESAIFSQALVQLFEESAQNEVCEDSLGNLENRLRDKMTNILGREILPTEYQPSVITEIHHQFCIDSLSPAFGFLFVSNPSDRPATFVLKRLGEDASSSVRRSIQAKSPFMYAAAPGDYELEVWQGDKTPISETISLSADAPFFRWLSGGDDFAQLSSSFDDIVALAREAGLGKEYLAALNLSVELARRDRGDDVDPKLFGVSHEIAQYASRTESPYKAPAEFGPDQLRELARYFVVTGRFQRASTTFQRLADVDVSSTRGSRGHVANAYWAAVAAGDLQSGKTIRKEFGYAASVDCQECLKLERTARASNVKGLISPKSAHRASVAIQVRGIQELLVGQALTSVVTIE